MTDMDINYLGKNRARNQSMHQAPKQGNLLLSHRDGDDEPESINLLD